MPASELIFMNESKPNGETATAVATPDSCIGAAREKLTKKAITADHPTWCPGCGDFAVLASFYKVLEKRQLDHEKIVTLAGIGCSSRFPYFVNGYGAHFIHGRAVPLASAASASPGPICTSFCSAATATGSPSAATISITARARTST